MTITRTIGKLPTATSDNNVDIAILNKSYLSLMSWVSTGNNRKAVYVYKDGDDSYETSVDITITVDSAKNPEAQRHVSVKLTSRQLLEDSVTGLITVGKKVSFGFFYEVPAEGTVTVEQIRLGLSTAYGLSCGTITAGVPDNGFLKNLAFLDPKMFGVV